jgi:predicted Co/Zn/Cd cation transporter (cation efflux family)
MVVSVKNLVKRYGDLIAKGIRVFLIIITFGIVFEYMGVGNTIITISFLIIFGGIIMTLSLALGIGLSHVVADLIKEKVRERGEKKKEAS